MSSISAKERLHQCYRWLRHRNGHGVHSPFVFNLIDQAISDRFGYYACQDIDLIRRTLKYNTAPFTADGSSDVGKSQDLTIAEIVSKEAIDKKHGELLFRLTNFLKPTRIIQVGAGAGLSTLYLSSYAKGLEVIILEENPVTARFAQTLLEKESKNKIKVNTGTYKELFPNALKEIGKADMIFFNTSANDTFDYDLFKQYIEQFQDGTVCIFNKIHAGRQRKELWKEITSCPEVTVTIDLYSMGLVFFNRKLHKRNYITYF